MRHLLCIEKKKNDVFSQGTKEAAAAGAAGLLGGQPSVLGMSPRLVAKGLAAGNSSTPAGGGGANSSNKAGESANNNTADGGGGGAAAAAGEGDGIMGEELYQVWGSGGGVTGAVDVAAAAAGGYEAGGGKGSANVRGLCLCLVSVVVRQRRRLLRCSSTTTSKTQIVYRRRCPRIYNCHVRALISFR